MDAMSGEGPIDRAEREATGTDDAGGRAEIEVPNADGSLGFEDTMKHLDSVEAQLDGGEAAQEAEEETTLAALFGMADEGVETPAAPDANSAQTLILQQLIQQGQQQQQAFQQAMQQQNQIMMAMMQRLQGPAQQPTDPLQVVLGKIPADQDGQTRSRDLLAEFAGALRQENARNTAQLQQMIGQLNGHLQSGTRQQQLQGLVQGLPQELQQPMAALVQTVNQANPTMEPAQVMQTAQLLAVQAESAQRALISKRRAARPKVPQVMNGRAPGPTQAQPVYAPKTFAQAAQVARRMAAIAQRNGRGGN